MLLFILGALAIGISLGLVGSGGSILTVPVLLIVLHRPEKLAIAESLAIVGGIALVGAMTNAFRGQVHWPSVIGFGLAGVVGAYFGAYGSTFVSSTFQIICFSLVMLSAAGLMFFSEPPQVDLKNVVYHPASMIRNGLLVGGLTGFVGIGGGFLIVPALVLLGNLPMHLAIGTSLMIIAFNAFTGFIEQWIFLRQQELHVNWRLISLMTSIGICGSLLGTLLNRKICATKLRKGFAVSIAIIGLYLLAIYLNKTI